MRACNRMPHMTNLELILLSFRPEIYVLLKEK